VDYQHKGLGLRANMEYKKNCLLVEFVGRITQHPVKGGYCMDFVRSDLEGEPTVGQLYTRVESNIFGSSIIAAGMLLLIVAEWEYLGRIG